MKQVIIGPPGTGKTNTLTLMAAKRIHEKGPKIACLAFTKRAAHESRSRMKYLHPELYIYLDYFRTLHSLGFRQLGLKKSQVFDIEGFAEFAGLHCTSKKFDPDENEFFMGATEDDQVISRINLVRAQGKRWEDLKSAEEKSVWNKMERYKHDRGLFDFDDMLVRFTKDGPFPKLHTIILDEGQDLTFRQRQAFNALCAHNPNALIIEALDSDQAIFSWAGSEVNLDEICDNADVEILGQSYRVPAPVHDLAMKIIKRCKNRKDVNWAPARHNGIVKWIMDIEDIDKSNRTNLLILVRNQCYELPYRKWLHEQNIEFGPIGSECSVRIGTIHESKGAEADNVLLDLNMAKKTWDQSHTDDEKRVWYTAITRAKKNLYIMEPKSRCNAGEILT